MQEGIMAIDAEIDVQTGYVTLPIPFYVNFLFASSKRHNGLIKDKIAVTVYLSMLDLDDPLTFNEREKKLVLAISETGKMPSNQKDWQCLLLTPLPTADGLVFGKVF